MKKYGPEITIGLIVAIIVIPMAIVGLLDVKLFPSVATNNDWIGFWGGYLGAIVGGIITLLVMYFTLKDGKQNLEKTFSFEEEKLQRERRMQFNNELLGLLVEYQTSIEYYVIYLRKRAKAEPISEEYFLNKAHNLASLNKVLTVKLESKLVNARYVHIQEVLDALYDISDAITTAVTSSENPTNLADNLEELSKVLLDEIRNYHIANENQE